MKRFFSYLLVALMACSMLTGFAVAEDANSEMYELLELSGYEAPTDWYKWQVIVYYHAAVDMDLYIVYAENEDSTEFYEHYFFFGEEQEVRGIFDDVGNPVVTYDKTGFCSGDVEDILLYVDEDAWVYTSAETAKGGEASEEMLALLELSGYEAPADWYKWQVIVYYHAAVDMDLYIVYAENEDSTEFYEHYFFFGEEQEVRGIFDDVGNPVVTYDKTGFCSGDVEDILLYVDEDAWVYNN